MTKLYTKTQLLKMLKCEKSMNRINSTILQWAIDSIRDDNACGIGTAFTQTNIVNRAYDSDYNVK